MRVFLTAIGTMLACAPEPYFDRDNRDDLRELTEMCHTGAQADSPMCEDLLSIDGPEDGLFLEQLFQLPVFVDSGFLGDLTRERYAFHPFGGLGLTASPGFSWFDVGAFSRISLRDSFVLYFTAPDAAPVECRLNDRAWLPCQGTFSGLNEKGVMELRVRSAASRMTLGRARWFFIQKKLKLHFALAETSLKIIVRVPGLRFRCRIDGAPVDCVDGSAPKPGAGKRLVAEALAGQQIVGEGRYP